MALYGLIVLTLMCGAGVYFTSPLHYCYWSVGEHYETVWPTSTVQFSEAVFGVRRHQWFVWFWLSKL